MRSNQVKLIIICILSFMQIGLKAEKTLIINDEIDSLAQIAPNCFKMLPDITINFTAIGAGTALDSIIVQNLTQGITVTVSAGNSLKLKSSIYLDETSVKDKAISIYPNPIKENAVVSFYATQTGNAQINVCCMNGKNVVSTIESLQVGENSFLLSLPKGTYVINVKGNGFSYSAKIICEANEGIKPKILYQGNSGMESVDNQVDLNSVSLMQYTLGDSLLYKGILSGYSAIITDSPIDSKTINFDFGVSTLVNKIARLPVSSTPSPTLTTTAISSITSTTAIGGGNITDNGSSYVIDCGVCWDTIPNPTKANNIISSSSRGATSFTSSFTGLSPSTTYYVRAYATNTGGYTAYGNEISFTTLSSFPTLTTNSVSSITSTSAICGGNITDGGNGYVISRGVCWSITTNPTIANNKTSNGTGSTGFTSNITGLSPLTTYYVRAYATNTSGNTGYGNENIFNTLSAVTPPILTTITVSSITSTSAISGGNISSDGGASVTACGICWSTTPNPTIANSTTSDRTGSTGFTSNITGLSPLTTYYIRAYATNSVGTAYGNEVSFITRSIYPTLTTNSVSSITSTSAICGGDITYEGNSYVISRGVCWSTSANPTIANSNTSDGTGSTGFTSSIIGLQPLITYHVRAYATNTAGNTAYGNEVIFNTLAATPPTLTTNSVSSITSTSAISGGNISSDGGAYVIVRGVCWSTTQNPTVLNSKTLNGEDIGNYESSITGLILGNTYYVRAYATNSAGTTYGSQVSFVTRLLTLPTVTTAAATSITSTSAVCGGVVNDDGGTPVTARGICFSTSENPTILNSSKISNGTGVGSFTCQITDLILNLTIYVRAYATNSVGTKYGDQISFKTALAVGDIYEGGKIAYIFKYGDPAYVSGQTHGLIAAFGDIDFLPWRNGNNLIKCATGTALGTGKTNTETICNNQGTGNSYAAKCCLEYSFGEYTDWFLPSQEELNKLYINRIAIGGFTTSNYWSSSQLTDDSHWAYKKDFSSGSQDLFSTDMSCEVRPIRYF
ncbi:MAG: T9SS type A sorting domain-containing protein [Bacteroidales bacterium]|nr:T9SS type A sorting domain-containing protein [Bacteroidales bacterium]